jgi:hypothetical protein
MSDADDDEAFETEAQLVEHAIERLAETPYETAGACLRGLSPTAVDVIASAGDDALEEVAGAFGDLDVYRALRFACALALTLKQAKRYADLLAPAEDVGGAS